MLDLIATVAQIANPLVMGVMTIVLGLMLQLLKRSPDHARPLIAALEKKAKETDTPIDDLAVGIMKSATNAAEKVLDKHIN